MSTRSADKPARKLAETPVSATAQRIVRATAGAAVEDEAAPVHPNDLFTKLARTGLLLDVLQRECLEPHGLAFAEYSVLRILQREPRRRLSPSRLAERIVRTTGAVTKLVDRLEGAGLVERRPDDSDGRAVQVQLTAAGGRLADAASRAYTAGRERVLARLSESEVRATMASLDRLIELLENDVAGVERRSR
ncbi:MAG: MarR family transcriptional regulator [Deltaproteobacteria bacterium]|nr:MarR family transcriptional regulator [Deltaproteobacteria bacterium]